MLKLLLVCAVVANLSRNIETCQICERFVPRMFRVPETGGDLGRMKKALGTEGLRNNVQFERNRNMNRLLEEQLEEYKQVKRGTKVNAKDTRIRITKMEN